MPVRPVPPKAKRALNILFASALLSLVFTLPYFSPPNIYTETSSRFGTSIELIFSRLSAIRSLTPFDEQLRSKIASRASRLLYLQYGPSTLAECPFCDSSSPNTYLIYALPSILFPHVLHLLVLGCATSQPLSGREGNSWRTLFTVVGLALALVDVYAMSSMGPITDLRVGVQPDVSWPFFWRTRTARFLAIAVSDLAMSFTVYLSSTNRLFVSPPSVSEKIEGLTRMAEGTNAKMHALGSTRNVIARDEALRRREDAYWVAEKRIMGEVREEREVLDSINTALSSGRLDVDRMEIDAAKYADFITQGVESEPAPTY